MHHGCRNVGNVEIIHEEAFATEMANFAP